MKQIQQFMIAGVLPEVKPNDDPAVFYGIFSMFMQTPQFAALPHQMKPAFLYRVGEYQMRMSMQQQAAAQQMATAQTAPPGQGQLPVGAAATQRTEDMFNNAGRGAMQNSAMPGAQ